MIKQFNKIGYCFRNHLKLKYCGDNLFYLTYEKLSYKYFSLDLNENIISSYSLIGWFDHDNPKDINLNHAFEQYQHDVGIKK